MPSVTFQGIGSGIDGAGIARAVRDQYLLQNNPRKNQISSNEKEGNSLEQLRSLMLDVSKKLDALRSINGGANAFEAKSSNTDVLSATADSSATTGNFTVSVSALAKTANGSFDRSFSSASSFILSDGGDAGAVNFTVGTGDTAESFSVAVNESTRIDDFVSSFNEKADGRATAQIINLGTSESPSYKVSFSTAALGTEEGSLSIAASNEALLSGAGLGAATLEQASNALFTVSGVSGTFERSSNVVNDVVAGVSFELKNTGGATIAVEQSASQAGDQLQAFVDSFNELAAYVNKEDAITQVTKNGEASNIYGSLASTEVDDNALSMLRSAISGASSADGSLGLASLGIKTERDGTLNFNREEFETGFKANPTKAREVATDLADTIGGVSGVVAQFTGYNRIIDTTLQSNEEEVRRITDTMERVENTAAKREETILKQFSSLESLIAKLNSESGFIAQLLKF